MDVVNNIKDTLIRYSEQQLAVLEAKKEQHIKQKQLTYFETDVKPEISEKDKLRQSAIDELTAQYNRDVAAAKATYEAKKAEVNTAFDTKCAELKNLANDIVASTEGKLFDNEINNIKKAIEILKGGQA